jgi:hypothetical protein
MGEKNFIILKISTQHSKKNLLSCRFTVSAAFQRVSFDMKEEKINLT